MQVPKDKHVIAKTSLVIALMISIMLAFHPLIISHSSQTLPTQNSARNGFVPSHIQSYASNSSVHGANSSYWYVGASSSDPNLQSNRGVRSSIQVRNQTILEGVLSFWVSESFSNNLWGQVGYYTEPNSNPIAFYQVWNLTEKSEVTTGTSSLTGGLHHFSIIELGQTSVWGFYVDNESIGTFDMSTNLSGSGLPIYAMSEEGYCATPFSFKPVMFSSAIQVLKSGSWYSPLNATSFGTSWGMEGRNQNSILNNNQVIVGDGSAQLLANSPLWS